MLALAVVLACALCTRASAEGTEHAEIYTDQTGSIVISPSLNGGLFLHSTNISAFIAEVVANMSTLQSQVAGSQSQAAVSSRALSTALSSLSTQTSLMNVQSASLTSMITSLSASLAAQSTTTATVDVSQSAYIGSLSFLVGFMSTRMVQMLTCSNTRQVYDNLSNACLTPGANAFDWSSSIACNATSKGDVRWNVSTLVYCSGSAWVQVYIPPLGSILNPAASCVAVAASSAYTGNGTYWLRLSDGTVAKQVCEGSANYGGDGSSYLQTAKSCTYAQKYFGVTNAQTYIDPTTGNQVPVASNSILVHCLNGASQGGNGSSLALSAVSCNAIWQYWTGMSGQYYVAGSLTACYPDAFPSCQRAKDLYPTLVSSLFYLTPLPGFGAFPAWCEMIGSAGWTVVIKAVGTDQSWDYNSTLWTTKAEYNPTNTTTGIDQRQILSPMYWMLPFSEIRIGMVIPLSNTTIAWANQTVNQSTSLFAIIRSGVQQGPLFDRATWKYLANNSSLELNCNQSGFNLKYHLYPARIGYVANNEFDCDSVDSAIGIGMSNVPSAYTVGSVSYGGDGPDGNTPGFMWVLLR
eukprot:m.239755 g.239755  ORF g.239755 m.239755 type:complete len:578 (-) comp54382_c0_seq7:168-1901(-)